MRQINIQIDAVAMSDLIDATSRAEVFRALGYLVQWNMTFPQVDLRCDMRDQPEIIATYLHEDGTVGYVIGAIWHDDHFGFHS